MKRIFTAFILLLISGFIFAQSRIYTPELVAPENAEMHQSPDVILDWNAVAGVSTVYYQLRLDQDPNFSDPFTTITEFSSFQTSELYFGETYYWQVRAWDDEDTSFWSEKRSFQVLNLVELSSPNNNKEDAPPNQEVKWELISGVSYFDIQVDTSYYLNKMDAGTNDDLNGVFSIDENNAYAVGNGGLVLHFDGTNWTSIDAGISEDLFDLYFVNENMGWVAGDGGSIFMYDGTTWTDQSPEADAFNAIYMIDENMGYATGADGFLYTYDGSAWTQSATEFGEEMQDIKFLNADFGVAAGFGGTIYVYAEGAWADASPGGDDLFAVAINAEDDVWVAGEGSALFHWDGAEWMQAEVDGNDDLFAIAMVGPNSGYALGEEEYLLIYDGNSWMEATSGVDFVVNDLNLNGDMGFAVGGEGLVLDFSNSAFNSPYAHIFTVASNDSTEAYNLKDLPFGSNIFWRVRARHSLDTSAWSLPRNFYTLSTVSLISPIGGDETDLIVKLRWKEILGLTGYRIQTDMDESFPDPETYFVDSTSIFQNGLTFGTTVYWRVRAVHETDMSDWSAPENYVTIGAVYLNSPANNEADVSVLPILDWDSIAGATSYQMQFADNPGFANIMYDEVLMASDHEYQVLFKLQEESDYYWRVRAMTTKSLTPDTSDWSEVYKFTTEGGIGIDEDLFNSSLEIYPNPANEEVFIKLENNLTDAVELNIMDLVGKSYVKRTLDFGPGMNEQKVDVSNLAQGIYIIMLQSGDASKTQKLVIEK